MLHSRLDVLTSTGICSMLWLGTHCVDGPRSPHVKTVVVVYLFLPPWKSWLALHLVSLNRPTVCLVCRLWLCALYIRWHNQCGYHHTKLLPIKWGQYNKNWKSVAAVVVLMRPCPASSVGCHCDTARICACCSATAVDWYPACRALSSKPTGCSRPIT